jgi:hypothetical protein
MRLWLPVIGLVAGLALAGSAAAALKDENLLVTVPTGFKLGNHAENAKTMLSEFIPSGENVDHWSKMITERIFRGEGPVDPEASQAILLRDWKAACPGGDGRRLSSSSENGYRVSYWSFDCPLNPQTSLPESMVRKLVAGKDALYDVQFAYRKAATAESNQSALDYLKTAVVCDTRASDHPCPSGLRPVEATSGPAPDPVTAFLKAADVNDFTAMAGILDRGSSSLLGVVRACYLRRVYSNQQTHELIAAWMCAEGPARSRVVLGEVKTVAGGKVSVTVLQNNVNERPAPERTGSAFAD